MAWMEAGAGLFHLLPVCFTVNSSDGALIRLSITPKFPNSSNWLALPRCFVEIQFPRCRQQRRSLKPPPSRSGWSRVGVRPHRRLRAPSGRLNSTGCQSRATLRISITSVCFPTCRLTAGRALAAGRCGAAATTSLINDAGDASSSLANTDTGRGDGPMNPAAPRVSLAEGPPPPDTSSRLWEVGGSEVGGRQRFRVSNPNPSERKHPAFLSLLCHSYFFSHLVAPPPHLVECARLNFTRSQSRKKVQFLIKTQQSCLFLRRRTPSGLSSARLNAAIRSSARLDNNALL